MLHLAALLVGASVALGADGRTRRAARCERPTMSDARSAHLAAVARVHPIVMRALWASVATGLVLFALHSERFVTSAIFWVKMGLLVGLLVNGVLMQVAERDAREADSETTSASAWRRLGTSARASTALWLLVAASGLLLYAVP
ncbi:MAG: hypothetical protein NVSMB59_20200 [Vulcanimicrobiaceae bacterium]